jgi:hypothetical protein
MVNLKEGDSSRAARYITGASDLLPGVNGESRLFDRCQGGTGLICNLDKERFFFGEFFTVTTGLVYEQRTFAFAILGVNP